MMKALFGQVRDPCEEQMTSDSSEVSILELSDTTMDSYSTRYRSVPTLQTMFPHTRISMFGYMQQVPTLRTP
jgi:hypothetical protein